MREFIPDFPAGLRNRRAGRGRAACWIAESIARVRAGGTSADQAVCGSPVRYSRNMSQRNDRYVGNDVPSLPQNTAEFRAAPDASASTAQFKAFASRQADGVGRSTDSGSWPEQPWAGE